MNKINRNRIIAVLISGISLSLTACGGKDTQEVIAVNAEIAEESSEEIAEEITTEIEPILSYVEEKGLTFTDEMRVQTQGTLCIGNDIDNADVINVDWELSNISISDTEDGIQIVLNQSIYGYIWSDGNIFKTNLNLPSALLCDINTGKLIPMTEEIKTKQIEWDEQKISITTLETESWEDGNSSDWEDDPSGGERLPSTLKVTDTIKVTKDYDALALVLIPITSADNIVGSYINDVWSDGCYLFSISDLSAKFEQIKDVQTAENEEEEEEIKQKETAPIEASKPKETTDKKEEEQKTSHTHNYTSTISIQPTCTTNGQKDFKCEICGDSYSETLGMIDHNYVATTTTIHHDAQYQTVKREVPSEKYISCRECNGRFDSYSDWENHILVDGTCSMFAAYDAVTVSGGVTYDYVETSPAYDEEVVINKCSVCGATTQ